MTADYLSGILAERLFGWRVGPDRYIMADRQWLKRERFQPAKSLDAAYRLLDAAKPVDFQLGGSGAGPYTVRVTLKDAFGEATNPSMPLAICVALARALGIEVKGVA